MALGRATVALFVSAARLIRAALPVVPVFADMALRIVVRRVIRFCAPVISPVAAIILTPAGVRRFTRLIQRVGNWSRFYDDLANRAGVIAPAASIRQEVAKK